MQHTVKIIVRLLLTLTKKSHEHYFSVNFASLTQKNKLKNN